MSKETDVPKYKSVYEAVRNTSFDPEERESGRVPQAHELNPVLTHSFNHLVKMGRHTKVTAGGRLFSFSALIIIGNQKGSAAIGYGKADKPENAIVAANRDAEKHMVHIYRYQNRTIPRPIYSKYTASKVYMWPRPPNFGLKGHMLLRKLALAFGFSDLSIKTHGSRNVHNMLRAFMQGVDEQIEAPEETARKLGKKYFNLNRIIQPTNLPLPPVPYSSYPYDSPTVQPWRRRLKTVPAS